MNSMSEGKIVILIGRSSTGKSTILNKLVEKYDYHNAISYTTRPMRQGEIDGRDYFFLHSNDLFDTMFDASVMFEKTEYLVNGEIWKYGIGAESFDYDKTNACIVNPHGLKQLLDNELLRDRIIVFEIVADTDTLIERYWERSDKSDKSKIQLVDRLLKDAEDFSDENLCELEHDDVVLWRTLDSGRFNADILSDDIANQIERIRE
jgi:guanylate kinase